MAVNITFMRVTLRTNRKTINVLAPVGRAIMDCATGMPCITGALLTPLGNGRWRLSGNSYEVEQALYLLRNAERDS